MSNMQKVLFVARVDSHILHFHLPYLQWFQQKGYEVHVASQGDEVIPYCDRKFNIPMDRFPLSWTNFKAYQRLKEIIDGSNYALIHCHTPTGGVLARLAARHARKNGTAVLYTAHGFHFYHDAPLINWLLYYPAEKYLAAYTDCLITINREDHDLAFKNNFCTKELFMTHGVGVDFKRFPIPSQSQKMELRRVYGIEEKTFLLVYVAELSKRKNQVYLLSALAGIKGMMADFKLLLVGDGAMHPALEQAVHEMALEKHVVFLGYCQDISKILSMCDLAVSVSRQEGLPMNVLEYLAQGLPVLLSDIRGHRDIFQHLNSEILFDLEDKEEFQRKILEMYAKREKINSRQLQESRRKIAEPYNLDHVMPEYIRIYEKSLSNRDNQQAHA